MIKFKWYNISCFQVLLGNHRIVFDPYLQKDIAGYSSFNDMDNIDMICISHSHFDHIQQLKDVCQYNTCPILMSSMIAGDMVELFDLSAQLVYPVYPNMEQKLAKLSIIPYLGRHAIPNRASRRYQPESVFKNEMNYLDESIARVMKYGFMDLYNYLITDELYHSILFWSGTTASFNTSPLCHISIDVLFLQIPSNHLEDNIELIKAIKPSYVVPHHHDIYRKNDMVTNLFVQMRQEIENLSFPCQFLEPNLGEWTCIE